MDKIKKRNIKIYQLNDGKCPFTNWLEALDNTVRYRIKSRLARVALGNLGEYKILGSGINELKFTFGAGYRIYYAEINNEIILLLAGGDKKTQVKDINLAKQYLQDYLGDQNYE